MTVTTQPSVAQPSATRGKRLQALSYAGLIVPMTMLHAPLVSSLPALYAKYTSASLAEIGVGLMILRLLDVVIDPAIGFLSDRTRSRFRRRKPWMLAGVLLSMAAGWFGFQVPPHAGVAYFMFAAGALYVAWTLVEIPHAAWLSEIVSTYDGRTRLAGWRAAAGFIGTLTFASLPLLPIFPTAAMTPDVLRLAAWIIVIMLPLAALPALVFVPAGHASAQAPASLRDIWKTLLTSAPLRLLSLTTTLSWLGSGMCGALYFFYLDVRLGILADFAYVGTTAAFASLAASLVWPRIIARIGKHRALAVAKASTAASLLGMALIQPGHFAFPALLSVFVIGALFQAGGNIALTAMVADAADYDTWKSGTTKTGSFYAAIVVCQKLGAAIGGGAAFLIVGLFGFHARGTNSEVAMNGFFLAFIAVPFVLNALAAMTAFRFPITRNAQIAIQRRLARR